MSRTWAGGSTRAWRRTRAYVLTRDAGKGCRAHTEGWCDRVTTQVAHTCTGRQDVAHHTLGRAITGDNPDHIIAACQPCNLHIGDPTKAADPPPRTRRQW